MRMLLGALALAASILHTGSRAGQVETLYTSPAGRTIAAFAQDGGLVAWFAPKASKGCNEAWLRQLGSARQPGSRRQRRLPGAPVDAARIRRTGSEVRLRARRHGLRSQGTSLPGGRAREPRGRPVARRRRR